MGTYKAPSKERNSPKKASLVTSQRGESTEKINAARRSQADPYSCLSKVFQRPQASSCAFLFASVALGASPSRMKP
jgi:hypothetical protein